MSTTIAVLGTLDTKGTEHAYIADLIRARGHAVILIDAGTGGDPQVRPDITREQLAAAGGIDLAAILAANDRGQAVTAMADAAAALLANLADQGAIHGVISLGGGGGTAIGTSAMRALPIGFPKLMVSTLAAGNTAPYVGTKDIVMMPSVVDIAGLNRISRLLLARAAGAICGMVETAVPEEPGDSRPLIAASMFGNTTDCVDAARQALERDGYEVLVFHATGSGGRTMESLIESGLIRGALDVTTTEWADELCGGVLSAGPTRLEAAGHAGIPAVVAPGCLDMVNFGEPDSVPDRFRDRLFYRHNPQVTLMRTNAGECAQLGRILAAKVNAYKGPVTVLLPLRGVSVISAEGGPFHDPEADLALFDAIRTNLDPQVGIEELDCTINDPAFAAACVRRLIAHLGET